MLGNIIWICPLACRTMGAKGAFSNSPKLLLHLVEGDKMGFHHMFLYSKYSDFSGELKVCAGMLSKHKVVQMLNSCCLTALKQHVLAVGVVHAANVIYHSQGGGGAPGPDPLRPLPPPPLPPGIGPRVPDHGRQRRLQQILLHLVEGDKMGFHHMFLYSKYSDFSGELNIGGKPYLIKYEYHPRVDICQSWPIP